MSKEIFKDVPGYEGFYQVSNFGNVRSLDREYATVRGVLKRTKGRVKRASVKKNGYLTVMFSVKLINKRYYVHRLVAICFIDNPKNKKCINHINGIKSDNNINNLEWVTNQENMDHARINGFMARGEKAKNSKLTEFKILAIRRLYRMNPKFNKLALSRKLKVRDTTIHKIIRRQRWKHI